MATLIDERTLEALDFAAIRERVIAATRTQRGHSYAQMLLPDDDFEQIRRQQAHTAAARELLVSADLHVLPAIETGALTQAAALGQTLPAQDLRHVGEAIAAAAAAYRAIREDETLREVTLPYRSLDDLRRAIGDAIDERDNVLDRASPALGRIRRSLRQAQEEARDRIGAILRSSKYEKFLQDAVVTIREGRFVVPVKAEFSGEFPGIVHDTSASGQTLFVEPLATLEANNRVRTHRIEEEREVQRILGELSGRIGEQAAAIEGNVEMLAQVDLFVAKAQVARAMDAVAPELDDAPVMKILNGRHPLLEERAVPQSFALDEQTRMLVISGPNMGGKTVTLKMAGLFVAMTYAGMQVPASVQTRIGRFEHVIADIGDEQSIVANASSFSAHLDRMREVLALARDRTLVLVDEIGGGTEPSSGAALAIAMIECLLDMRTRGIVTTHATELKLFAHSAQGITNASVRFDPQTFAPTYHLDIGTPGQSLAFALARARGIGEPILERAQSLVDSRERDYERALDDLAQRNAELQAEYDALADERSATAQRLNEIAQQQTALDAERERFSEHAEERMRQALRDFSIELQRRAAERDARRPRVSAGQSAELTRTLEAMRRDLGIKSRPREPGSSLNETFAPNDLVRVRAYGGDGTVVEDYGETLLVAFGAMKTVVSKSEVERAGPSRGGRMTPREPSPRLEAMTRAVAELDVRGKRYTEAEPLVDRWIDEALLAGNSPLRLIHGKGTGMLGRGLQAFLRDHPAVAGVRYGTEEEGSHGVTIIELR